MVLLLMWQHLSDVTQKGLQSSWESKSWFFHLQASRLPVE